MGRRQRRFFILHPNRIDWHLSEETQGESPKGSIKLYPDSKVEQQGPVLVVTTEKQILKLGSDVPAELDNWAKDINEQIIARSQQRLSDAPEPPAKPSVARLASTAKKSLAHKMLDVIGRSDDQRLRRLVDQGFAVDCVLMRFLFDKAWAKRRKNEAQQFGEKALRERCVAVELLTEVEQALQRVQAAREDAHAQLVAARSEKMSEQNVETLSSAIEHAISVHLHHKTHVVGAELGSALIARAKEWLQRTIKSRADVQRRLTNGLEARPALLDTGALEAAINDSVLAGGVADETIEGARSKLTSIAKQRRESAAVAHRALPPGVMAHIQELEALTPEEERKAMGRQDLKQLATAIESAEEVGVAHASHVWEGGAAVAAASRGENQTEPPSEWIPPGIAGKTLIARMRTWESKVEGARREVDDRLTVGKDTPAAEFDAAAIEEAIHLGETIGASQSLIGSCRTKLADVLASRVMALNAIDASWASSALRQDTGALRQALEAARTYGVAHPTYVRRSGGDEATSEPGREYVARAQAHLDAVEASREAVRVLLLQTQEPPDKIDTVKLAKGLEDAKVCGGFEPNTLEHASNLLETTVAKREAAAAAVCEAWRELATSSAEHYDVSAEGGEGEQPPANTSSLTKLISALSDAQLVGVAIMGELSDPLSFTQYAVPGSATKTLSPVSEDELATSGAKLLLLIGVALSTITKSRQEHFELLKAKLVKSRRLLMKAETFAADGRLQGGTPDYAIASKANALRTSLEAELELATSIPRDVPKTLDLEAAASRTVEVETAAHEAYLSFLSAVARVNEALGKEFAPVLQRVEEILAEESVDMRASGSSMASSISLMNGRVHLGLGHTSGAPLSAQLQAAVEEVLAEREADEDETALAPSAAEPLNLGHIERATRTALEELGTGVTLKVLRLHVEEQLGVSLLGWKAEIKAVASEFAKHPTAASKKKTAAVKRFQGDVTQLVVGPALASVKGILAFIHADEQAVLACLAQDHGVSQIEREFTKHGTAVDRECFQYIRHGRTGESKKVYDNGVMDSGRKKGMRLEDFLSSSQARAASLTVGMVLALRLYTTACYASLNTPLRAKMSAANPHPFPVTVHLITEGSTSPRLEYESAPFPPSPPPPPLPTIFAFAPRVAVKRLRAVEGSASSANDALTLWRGMKNVEIGDAFFNDGGGSEKAPMSTTHDLRVAVRYAVQASSTTALLLKLNTRNFRERGADLRFLSCFEAEAEVLFPPLTHLSPTQSVEHFEMKGIKFTVVEVEPSFG